MDNFHSEKPLNNSEELLLRDVILKIVELWRYLISKWKIIFTVTSIFGALGLGYAIFKDPIYKADLSFALQDERSGGGLGSLFGLANQLGADIGVTNAGGEFGGDNLLELLKSRSMIEKTLLTKVNINGKVETLAELYIDFNGLRRGWAGKSGFENVHFPGEEERAKFSLKQDSVLGVIYKDLSKNNLNVSRLDKKLSIITITVNSKNERFSKYFTETLASVVSKFYIQTKIEKSTRNVAIIQRQVDSVRTALNAAISGVASSADASPNPNPSLQVLHVPSQRRQVDVTANSAILSELVKNLEIAKVSLLQETPLIHLIDTPILPLEKERTGVLKGILIGAFLGLLLCSMTLIVIKSIRTVME